MSKDNTWDQVNSVVFAASATRKTINKKPKQIQVDPALPKKGWGPARDYVEYQKKELDKWNNNDIRWYFKDKYFEKYGAKLHVPIIACHNEISQILYSFSKKLGTEPPKSIFKDYIDYFFDRFADEEIKSRGKLSFYALTRERAILLFVDNHGLEIKNTKTSTKAEEIKVKKLDLDIGQITDAYRISPKNMLLQYGLVITANFLILIKNKSAENSIKYIENGLLKLTEEEKEEVIKVTKNWGPYPKYLKIISVDSLNISISSCDENAVFNCFKEKM